MGTLQPFDMSELDDLEDGLPKGPQYKDVSAADLGALLKPVLNLKLTKAQRKELLEKGTIDGV